MPRLRAAVPVTSLAALALALAAAPAGPERTRTPRPARNAVVPESPPAGTVRARLRRPPARLTTRARIRAASRYAASRAGTVAFAVLHDPGRVHGLRRTQTFPSASLVKTVLMVAELRRAKDRPLEPAARARIEPMMTSSDNDAALASYAVVGKAGLMAAARAARLRRFAVPASLFDAQVTAADQARLLLRVDGVVPPIHRRYARHLLSSVVAWQRWGIPTVASTRRLRAFFKGGWRPGLTHQAALLERGRRQLALAVLTTGSPSPDYAIATIRGIATRVLR